MSTLLLETMTKHTSLSLSKRQRSFLALFEPEILERSSSSDIRLNNAQQEEGLILIQPDQKMPHYTLTITQNIVVSDTIEIHMKPGISLDIIVENNVSVTIREIRHRTKPSTENVVTVSSVSIRIGENSQVQYIYQAEKLLQNDIQLRQARLGKSSSCTWHLHYRQNDNIFAHTHTVLEDRASVTLLGTYQQNEGERILLDYEVVHERPDTSSNILVHGVGSGKSRSEFVGKIHISAAAVGSDAHLDEHCLLFSEQAKHDSMPILEINTNEVKATHSASITQIDENYLFYLASRGIDEASGKELIKTSFLESILGRMPGTRSPSYKVPSTE